MHCDGSQALPHVTSSPLKTTVQDFNCFHLAPSGGGIEKDMDEWTEWHATLQQLPQELIHESSEHLKKC